MTTIYVLLGIGAVLLLYQLVLNNDPDDLDKTGHRKRRKR